jgi:predicted dehydrogenase
MADVELRIALIGYGLSGSLIHAPLVAATPGMRVTSVVTSNPRRRSQAEHDIPGVTVEPAVDELLERAGDHDLAVVTSPTGSHREVSLALLGAGLPLVVDKPMASTAEEAREMADTAASRGLLLTVFHNRRWDGNTLTVARLLGDGAIGAPLRFESRFERYRATVRQEAWREQVSAKEGGGVLLDLGSHVVDQALHLFGPAISVFGEVRALRPGAVVDDDVFVAIEHEGGMRSHLWASAVAAVAGPAVRLLGLGGGYLKQDIDIQEEQLRAGIMPDNPAWGIEPPARWGRLVTPEGERPLETERGDWARFYALLADALRSGAPPPVSPASAVAVMEVLDAARASAAAGEVVRLG